MTDTAPLLQPVRSSERIDLLDTLRGVALLGILLMNIEGFAGPLDLSLTGIDPRWQGLDYWADAWTYVFVQGKFYPLFSLLFGMGFAVMLQRAEAAGRALEPVYLRRSAGLAVIGLCHGVLLWSGDILLWYAVLSLLLLAFAPLPQRWLPVLGVASYLASGALILGLGVMVWLAAQADGGLAEAMQAGAAAAVEKVEQQRQAFGDGTYLQAVVQRGRDVLVNAQGLMLVGPQVLGMFLLGSWFVRSGVIQHPAQHRRLFAWLRWGAWPAGLAVMLASVWVLPWMAPGRFDLTMAVAFSLAALAGLLMALGYLAWFSAWARWLRWAAPAGRMALTNYLLQSVVCTAIFYGYGFGLFEQVGRAGQLALAVAVFAVQVAVSHWWLRRFQFGPVEWVWRAATYGRWPALRRSAV